jgi:hypothetical protein
MNYDAARLVDIFDICFFSLSNNCGMLTIDVFKETDEERA